MRGTSRRLRAAALAGALVTVGHVAQAQAQWPTTQPADLPRWYGCDWKFKPKDASGVRTVTFSVDPAIPSAFVDGVLLWNTRMTKIRFQKTSTNPDFRITPGNGGEQAAFFGLDGAQVRDDNLLALCGGLGGAMLRGRVGIVVDPFINLLGPATQRVVGAHESGHALGLNHWYAISGTGSRWYWVSVMTAYQTVDSGHNPLGPTVTDGQDVDSYYAK